MGFNRTRTSQLCAPIVYITAALLIGLAGSAHAADTVQVVHARKLHFKALGRADHFLRDQLHRSSQNWHWIGVYAKQIAVLSKDLPTWFPAGSGQGHGVDTRASRAIWKKPAAFARAAHRMTIVADRITVDAAKHNVNALAFDDRALGHSCDSCHRAFRTRRHWW